MPARNQSKNDSVILLFLEKMGNGTWNSLPADILTCDSESGFKRLLKTHLFNNCFNVA